MQEIYTLLIDGNLIIGEDAIKNLTNEIHIKGLSDLGVIKSDFARIIDLALATSSMKGNPVALSREELERILTESV